MPKKRQQLRSFKPYYSVSSASSPSDRAASSTRSVNDLLASLRRSSAASHSSRDLAGNTPSVPPAIREILQIPETPAPAPRRPTRARFDAAGRRLPPGPPPPRSWLPGSDGDPRSLHSLPSRAPDTSVTWQSVLPGAYLPSRGSLIDLLLRDIALDWHLHRVYNLYHLYFLPNHLKPPLIRLVGLLGDRGITLSDLKLLLLPPAGIYEDESEDDDEPSHEARAIRDMTCLDLTGSICNSIRLKDVTELLFPTRTQDVSEEPEESWDTAAEQSPVPAPSPDLLPNLTHVSLALDPQDVSGASWRQLLAFSSRAPGITHLCLANWPDPCLTPRSRLSSVASPDGGSIPYSGTNYYSHSLDHDWSEALLVLRKLSRNLYELEYLDLTGCAPWFTALMAESDHDFVDWSGSWGKIGELRLRVGWRPGEDALESERTAYRQASETAAGVEKHIRSMRAGQGRFITVARDREERI